MRTKLRTLVIQLIEKGVAVRFPEFSLETKRKDALQWKHQASDNLFFFISMDCGDHHDGFAVRLKWNTIGDYHTIEDGPWVFERVGNNKGGCLLPFLWNCKNGESSFDLDPELTLEKKEDFDSWTVGDPMRLYFDPTPLDIVLERTPAVVEDILEKLVEYGVPLFCKVADAHNVTLPADWPLNV